MEASSSCSSPYFPKTVEEIFRDYSGRRAGLIRALTQDDDNLCLYGHPNGTWELSLPVENVPSKIPEPCVGINFARQGGMNRRDWISIVALHSDSWLMSVAFFQGACVGLSQSDRG
ncbi:hypothetical protein QVD17_15188 [Tagetes erecta]|uniref:PHD finger protein ALFIN-LIKE n=1 Tax=Tagetes erecta TaxID=13708 RepID=A0AAD8NZG3_TARER|nr:hypothetical protein QVD17_15188 [Tagetes erecta]